MKTKISNLDAEESYSTRPTFTFFAAICGRFNREPPPPSFRSILLPLCSFLPPPLDTSTLQNVGTEIRRFLSLSPFFFLVSFSRPTSRTTFSYNCSLLSLSRFWFELKEREKKRKEKGWWKKDLLAASSARFVDTVPSSDNPSRAYVSARVRVHAVNVISNKQISGWLDVNHARKAIRLNFGLRDEFARILEVAYRASIERAARERSGVRANNPQSTAGRPDVRSTARYTRSMWIIGRALPFHAAYAVEPPVTKQQLHSSSTTKNPDYSALCNLVEPSPEERAEWEEEGAEISPIPIFFSLEIRVIVRPSSSSERKGARKRGKGS